MKNNHKHPDSTQRRNDTNFERKWGIHALDLAQQEKVTPDAIHMRVYLWGNPFRRKSKPTKFEARHGFTQYEMALKLGMHPVTVWTRLERGIDPVTLADPAIMALPPEQRALAAVNPDVSINNWRHHRKVINSATDFWLHPQHPAYDVARAGNLTPEQIQEIQRHG